MRQPNSLKRKAMALPLTLVILLFGSVLVATAFYIVQNMYSTSRHSVTHTELYNAAQTGVEMAKTVLWESGELWEEPLEFNPGDGLDAVRAIEETEYPDGDPVDLKYNLRPILDEYIGTPGVEVSVDILDCNYTPTGTLGEDDWEILPPLWVGGEGTVTSADIGPPEGTSVIIDPSRLFNLGGGGAGQRRYVIRSTASHNDSGMEVTIEAMVVVRKP